MGSSTTGTRFGVVLAVFLSSLCFSFNFSPVLYFHVLFPFCFWSLFVSHSFGHTLNLLLGEKSLPPSVFAIDVGGWIGMIPGVLLHVTRACILGVAFMLARMVCANEVCALLCCCVSKFSVALSNILLIYLKLGHVVLC